MARDEPVRPTGHVSGPEGVDRFGPTPAGEMVTLLAAGEHTDGRYDFMVTTVEPGPAVVPLHVHHRHDEAFFVLEGELEVRVADRTAVLSEGSFVRLPMGVPHAWRNASAAASRFVCIFAPGDHVGVLADLAALDDADGDPDPERFAPILDDHDVEMVGPPIGDG